MAEIINIPDFGEVRLSLKDYNDMRDRIRKLEEDNDALVEERDEICDENKVRLRRQTIRITEYSTNPRANGQEEIIEDRLINMEDITQELDEKMNKLEADCKRNFDELKAEKDSISKTLEECQRQKIDLELEVERLKHRTWWQRLWNK